MRCGCPFHVSPESLPAFIGGLRTLRNLAGFTVTMPHKQAIIPLLDDVSQRVHRCGAANLIRRDADGRLSGDIADGVGFIAGLRNSGISLTGRNVGLAGAGGAGIAIAWALAEEHPACISVAEIDGKRRERLTSDLAAAFPHVTVNRGLDRSACLRHCRERNPVRTACG